MAEFAKLFLDHHGSVVRPLTFQVLTNSELKQRNLNSKQYGNCDGKGRIGRRQSRNRQE